MVSVAPKVVNYLFVKKVVVRSPFRDSISNLSVYIADIGGLYKLPLKKVVIERKYIEKCETHEE